jgi:Flp pilus assembly pilin Flp
MSKVDSRLHDWRGERVAGQGLVEYALILVLIAIGALLALGNLGTTVSSIFDAMAGYL